MHTIMPKRKKKMEQTPNNTIKTFDVECTFAQTLQDGNMLYEAGKSYMLCPEEVKAFKQYLKPRSNNTKNVDDC